jgi:hypothetical protein
MESNASRSEAQKIMMEHANLTGLLSTEGELQDTYGRRMHLPLCNFLELYHQTGYFFGFTTIYAVKAVVERSVAMKKLFFVGVFCFVLCGACFAEELHNQIDTYDVEKLEEIAASIRSDTKIYWTKSFTPSMITQASEQAQLDFSYILIRQNDELIRQNNEIIRLLRKIAK